MDFNPTAPYQASSEAANAETRGTGLECEGDEHAVLQEPQQTKARDQQAIKAEHSPRERKEKVYAPLSEVRHELLTTDELAHYLRLKVQTIRKKHMEGTLGIKPIKVGGRLLWPIHVVTGYIKKLSSN